MASYQFLPLSDQAARQLIDATTVFEEYRRVRKEAARLAGGMYWKKQGQYEYLIKTWPDNRSKSLGPRNAGTEQAYASFTQKKARTEARLKDLGEAVREAERMNKALRVGRAPAIVVEILQALEKAGLDEHFIVVGTHALYAYESAAGVRIAASALATKDVDLLWDARKRVQFLTDIKRLDGSVLGLLQKVDPSFERMEEQKETAINSSGFQVDFLRRMQVEGDPNPLPLTEAEGDLFVVQARRASVLNEAPPFEYVIVSATGRMVSMRTIDPAVFVQFKQWLGALPEREAVKRGRDRSQAEIVQAMLEQKLLVSKIAVAGAAN
jgi:hypothetical protein